MILALDTNALIALLAEDHPFQARVTETLEHYEGKRHFVISPFVYAEAHSIPNFQKPIFHSFLRSTRISVDTTLPNSLWERAGVAHAQYHERRRRSGYTKQKRLLTDFLIGAHALSINAPLVTFDEIYRKAFPELELLP